MWLEAVHSLYVVIPWYHYCAPRYPLSVVLWRSVVLVGINVSHGSITLRIGQFNYNYLSNLLITITVKESGIIITVT